MKTIWMLFLTLGISASAFGQVVSNYTVLLNNDTSPLNATVEQESFILKFMNTDVLTIIFSELKSDITKKTVKVISDSKKNVAVIGTFTKERINKDKSYTVNIPLKSLNIHTGMDNIYTIIITDVKGKQDL